MAHRKSKDAAKQKKGDQFMKQMGLLGPTGDSDDDDIDLEAELMKLNNETPPSKSKKAKPKEQFDLASLDALVKDIDKDIGSDEELSGDDEDFMMELEALGSGEDEEEAPPPSPSKKSASKPPPPPAVAEKPKSVAKSLQPAVAPKPVVPAPKPTDASPAPASRPKAINEGTGATAAPSDSKLQLLTQRRSQYHNAAMKAKQAGNQTLATKYLRTRKDFDKIIEAVEGGQEVDLSAMPPPPRDVASPPTQPAPKATPVASLPEPSKAPELSAPKAASAPAPGGSAADTVTALQERQQKFKESEAQATEQGNSGKARRLGRIIKQYNDAIKATKLGKPFEYSELPQPPGFSEIVAPSAAAPPSKAPPNPAAKPPEVTQTQTAASAAKAPVSSPSKPAAQAPPAPKPAQAAAANRKPAKRQASLSIQEKQLELLQERHTQYKKAALDAKTHDDKQLALKYMRIAKGLNPMIQAATNGLPVDMGQVPPPPTESHDTTTYVIVEDAESEETTPEERVEEFEKIIKQLKEQIKTSSTNAIHFKTIGDVKNSCMFQTYEQNCRKDLDAVQNAFRHKDPPPKFHYEDRRYSMVRVNTDLGDGDFQIKIHKGTQYPLPPDIKSASDLDTQVHYELAWPQDAPQKAHSDYGKHSDSPTYNSTSTLKIDRRSKAMLRLFKNRKLKMELFYRRGFLKADKHFATVSIKLEELESVCTLHRSFDLLDTNGRKEIGGKLEVELRLREPLSGKQVEVITNKWLVIDQFVRLNKPVHKDPPQTSKAERRDVPSAQLQVSNVKLQSLQVLKFEKKELDTKIRQLSQAGQLRPADMEKLTQRSGEMTVQIDGILTMMKRNELSPHEYIQFLNQLHANYGKAVQAAAQSGDRKRQQVLGVKKDIVQREIREMQGKASSKS